MSKKIKSTLELALERAAKLPALTAEEIRQRLEREYAPRGRAIAERFLGGDLAETRLQTELGEFRGEEGEIVRGVFLASMRQSIDLETPERTARAFEGVKLVVADAFRTRGFEVQASRADAGSLDPTLELVENGRRFLVDCTDWRSSKAGAAGIRGLHERMTEVAAAGGFAVTSGQFTPEAKHFASAPPSSSAQTCSSTSHDGLSVRL